MGTFQLLASCQHPPPPPHRSTVLALTHRGIFRTGGDLKVIERIPLDVQDVPSVPADLGVVRVQLSCLQNSVTGMGEEAGGMTLVPQSVGPHRISRTCKGQLQGSTPSHTPCLTLGGSLHFSEPFRPPWYRGGYNECFTAVWPSAQQVLSSRN